LIYWAEDNFNPATKKEMTMFNTIKTALAAALIVGAASAAFASNENTSDQSVSTAQSIRESRENQLPWWWNTPSTGRPGDAFGLATAIHQPASSHSKTRRDR
jgi:hypothetical protein